MKLGLFGGSFDPIHQGHVIPVREARSRLALDRVIFLPTARPPHKPGREMAPPVARYAMVEIALLDEEGLFASPQELTLGRPAYTVETVEHFRREEPDAEIHLLLGSDSVAGLHRWRRWAELLELVRVVILARPGWRLEEVLGGAPPDLARTLSAGRGPDVIERPVDVSATRLRAEIGAGGLPRPEVLHPRVLDYVRKYRLYR